MTEKPINEMKLSFISRSANEGFARASVAAFICQLDPTVDELSDIKTAVSEAVSNCIIHGYKDTIGTVYIYCAIYKSGKIKLRIKDKGCGIENIEQAMEPMYSTGGDERGGLGFTVMECFTDKLKVSSKSGKGTTVLMEKKIKLRGDDC